MIQEIDDTTGTVATATETNATRSKPPAKRSDATKRARPAKAAKVKAATADPAGAKEIAVSVIEKTAPPSADIASAGVKGKPVKGTAKIERLAAEIRDAFANAQTEVRQCESHMGAAVGHARKVGGLLNQARRLVPHGGWEKWLGHNVPGISLSTALRWMKLAANPSALTDSGGPGSKTAAYRALGLMPGKPRGQQRSGAAIAGGPHDAGAGDAACDKEQPGPAKLESEPATEDADDAATKTAASTATGDTGDAAPEDDGGPATEAEFLGLLGRLEKVMAGLRDPDAPMSAACLRRAQAFGRLYRGFVEAVAEYVRAKAQDKGQLRLPLDDGAAGANDAGAAR